MSMVRNKVIVKHCSGGGGAELAEVRHEAREGDGVRPERSLM